MKVHPFAVLAAALMTLSLSFTWLGVPSLIFIIVCLLPIRKAR